MYRNVSFVFSIQNEDDSSVLELITSAETEYNFLKLKHLEHITNTKYKIVKIGKQNSRKG